MKKIGFFGGCFNPPTNIHIKIAIDLIKDKKVDKVVFVPVNDYYKKENLAQAKHRYNMLKLATRNYKELEVDDIEIRENRVLFATDAFKLILNSKFINSNDDKIFLLMGSDNFKSMYKWKDYNNIKDSYNYLVIDRDENQISSTQIRKMISNNDKDVEQYLSKAVYEYIIENKLYKL